eukprot:scaffold7422_cov73-Skeletonema_dohrnii-CCMP3373.AAC.4
MDLLSLVGIRKVLFAKTFAPIIRSSMGRPADDPAEALLLMWPPKPKHLELVLELTNPNLKAAGKQELTEQELVKWLGACLLITRLDYFGSRRDLWDDPKSYSKYTRSRLQKDRHVTS